MRCLSEMRWRRLRITFLFLLLLFSVWFSASASAADISTDSDKWVLLNLKSSVSDPSGMLSNWKNNSNHCSWSGVVCNTQAQVVALNITGGGQGNSNSNSNALSCSILAEFRFYGFGIRTNCSTKTGTLVGKLSPSIGKLTQLRVLSLPFNDFTGEIPSEIWGLKNLQVLDLEGNSISGTLPVELGGLKKLRVVNLGFNEFVGEIPHTLLNCVGLEILNLAGNRLNGSIPAFFGKFSRLRGLYLSLNRLVGFVPDELGENCWSLEHLDLSGNLFVGGIPASLGNCTKLRSLLLFSNLLEDVIPPGLGRLEKLQVLDVSRNSLSGRIPAELGGCVELAVLVLSNLFDPFADIVHLRGGYLSGQSSAVYDDFNYYEGGIPDEVTMLPKLRILWVPRALLEGPVPSSWGSCESLEMVNIADNFFTGEIPKAFRHCKNLHFLNISSNRLVGELDVELAVPCMSMFDASSNHFSGPIPIFNYSSCPRLSLSNAYSYSYDPFSAYSSYFTHQTQAGRLFPSYAEAGRLIFHNFGGNNFSGPLPSLPIAPQNSRKETAYAFLAGGNNFTGSFPGGLFEKCDLVNGMILNVSNNHIYGSVPSEIGKMCRCLKLLDVSGNQITGYVPESFGDSEFLVGLDMSQNKLQGLIPEGLGRLKGLKYLSFATNDLTGNIPTNLGRLYSLEVLQLSSNSLSGEIPKDLVNLRNLTVLLLNNNELSGQIPAGLVNLTSLIIFNVSFNNLSGPLPVNESLIKCSSYVGNPFLRSCRLLSVAIPSSDIPGGSGTSQSYAASPSESKSQRSENSGFNSIEIASIVSASAIVSVLLALIVLFLYTRKCIPRSRVRGSDRRREVTVFNDIGVPLTFENVVRGTGSFNASNCIGNGGFGATYKAEISPGVLVAIKRLSVGRFQGVQQFHAEIKTLGTVRHQNLVTLIGYHASETEMFLIYNYLSGGNLEKFIQERPERAVDWKILHKIAIDIARALAYLHDQCVLRILHRDVKPSNILLDEEYNAYLSDFGLARLLGTSETHATTGVAGTFGYVAPEYAMTCRVSDKADVYSYGVVLLELISDKKALDPSFSSFGNGFNIVGWACMLLRQGRAKEFFTAGLWDAGPHNNLVETLHLAVMCTVDSLSIRPTMKQVVQRLKQLQPPPS